ncbi:hypothetical protein FISHEDRAFT_64716 [Fistulina hepatica ATCC 64428]|uniref:CAP-Gly domain-containing protein n=1 Tax=Fistulina hepatica ATCC 64428 TaxID=1128425 RepID=A0A0D7AGT6_9AGAR|nr:hypothetical protein FISHEDRAFT_64716 [Fistulina hepatica ATCC 64428]
MSGDPPLGTIVEIPAGRGVVRFVGSTSFASGKWVGVELYEPNGKNNGTIKDTMYFSCKMLHGVFVRPSQIKQMLGSENDVGPSHARPKPLARSTAGHRRTDSTGLTRAGSLKSSPSIGSSRSASPGKQISASPSLQARLPARAAPTTPSKRLILHQPRKSLSMRQSPTDTSPPPAAPAASHKLLENSLSRKRTLSSSNSLRARQTSPSTSPLSANDSRVATPPPPPLAFSSLSAETLPERPSPQAVPAPPPPVRIVSQVDEQELQELRAKIRVLEAKRGDDARHIRELEARLGEAESFVALRPKLQAKLTSQQTELIATRRDLADAQQLSELAESRLADSQEQLEMAMLDKEVAEERAEIAEAELEEIKERLAVVEVELNVIKSGESAEGMDQEAGKNTLAYIQLEKQNERLKEALVRLRDVTQQTDQEQRQRISEMEKDLTGIDDLHAQYDTALVKLSNAEVQIEDLKLQLDDALGAEEMLVQLTERNLMLGEKIEEMRITIEDLEALKELNDELEENHVETEKALNEDIEAKNMEIQDLTRKIEVLELSCQDYDGTITQFRELVVQLQGELDALRTQTQTAQSESATAVSQTAAVMSLNLKLQSSALRTHARNIEHEITKLEAKEAKELLGIFQPYLPQLYVESDVAATYCYMFFRRLGCKADLINSVVAQQHNLPDSLNGSVSDMLVGVCEMRGRISNLSNLCKRFAAILSRCDVETFLNIGRLYPEIAPMEKRIDMHIDLLRRDEFREMECVSDVVRIQAQFDHIAESYFEGFQHDLAERELGYITALDHDLDMFAASMGLIKTSVKATLEDDEVVADMGGYDIEIELFAPMQDLLDQCRPVKNVSKKLIKRLEDLVVDNNAVKSLLEPRLKALSALAPELVNFGFELAQKIVPYLSDVRAAKSSFQLTSVLAFVKQIASSTAAKNMKPGVSVWGTINESIANIASECNDVLPDIMEIDSIVKVTGLSPWIARVEEIKAATAINVEAGRKVAQMNDEMQGLLRNIKAKDQHIQESAVKIELMERRMEAAKRQADAIADLEGELSKARKQERAYEEAMEQLQADIDSLEQDNAKLKVFSAGKERQPSAQQAETEAVPVEGNLETSYLLEQIEALRGTVRFLRTENAIIRGHDMFVEIEALPPLPEPPTRTPTPPLVPSSLSDSDSDSDLDDPPPPPLSIRSLDTAVKVLYRDVVKFSTPRVVDLSILNERRAQRQWIPMKHTPAFQVLERKREAERLTRRLRNLLDQANAIL